MYRIVLSILLLLLLGTTALAGGVFNFPISTNDWNMTNYPAWWHANDTVSGTFVTTGEICHVSIYLKLYKNTLTNGGQVNLDFRVDGVTVGSFVITEADGLGPIEKVFSFSPIAAGNHELRYLETNTVFPGGGSVKMVETIGINWIEFSPVALARTTWGAIKASL